MGLFEFIDQLLSLFDTSHFSKNSFEIAEDNIWTASQIFKEQNWTYFKNPFSF